MPRPRNGRARALRIFGLHLNEQRVRRTIAALMTAAIVFFLLLARLRPEAISYKIGDTATRTIKANRAATFIDKQATERLRDEAAKSVLDVYSRDPQAEINALMTVHDIFSRAAEIRANQQIPKDLDKIDRLREVLGIQLSPETLRILIQGTDSTLQRVQQAAVLLVRQIMNKQIRNNTDDLERAREDVARLAEESGLTEKYRGVLVEVTQVAIQPNVIFDAAATEAKREEARDKVPEVRRQLQPGDIVISKGETVTQQHLDMFTALGLIQPSLDYVQALSLLGVVLLLTLVLTLYLRVFAREVYQSDLHFHLLCFTLIAVAGSLSVFKTTPWFDVLALSVTTAAAIFISLTLRAVTSIGAGFYLGSLVVLAAPGSDARLLMAATLCALIAGFALQARSSRSATITRAAFLLAVSNSAVLTVVSYVFGFLVNWQEVGYAALGGFLSAITAAGLISVIERPLGLTTNLRLLELQDPNEPILKRLLTEAPGSYQSSVMVANIAEPAAEAVGADPVLTRTACMYHDIGKLKRPYFFVENQFGAENPHVRLSPHLSALVIMSHVKDGMDLAEEIKLPPVVASIIPQHHGTTLASFMYQRAQAEAAEGEEIRESDFRYPGPKPQTKENAVIMLADTVEAAARSLADTSPESIEAVVDRLVNARIDDGQLDESPLTFADITVLKKSFVKTLTGMFHQRLPYPSEIGRPNEPSPPDAQELEASATVGDGD